MRLLNLYYPKARLDHIVSHMCSTLNKKKTNTHTKTHIPFSEFLIPKISVSY